MRLLTISNLYPRPDQPQRGMFNRQLFRVLAEKVQVTNVCLVPSWQLWRWRRIRRWKDPCGPEFTTHYVPVFYVPFFGRSWSWKTYGWTCKSLKPLVAEADVLYVPWIYPDGVVATRLGHKLGKHVWLKVLGSDTFHLRNSRRRKVILDACEHVDGIVCVWRGLAERLISFGVPPAKIHVVPNGVDTDHFTFRTRQEALTLLQAAGGISESLAQQVVHSKIVLSVGNLVPVKGPDILLEAFAQIRGQRSEVRRRTTDDSGQTTEDRKKAQYSSEDKEEKDGVSNLGSCILHPVSDSSHSSLTPKPRHVDTPILLIIIGSGPMRAALERRARELGSGDSVFFLGSRPHAEVALWMNIADCLCSTSRSEGMPNVVLEAQTSGLPVVGTDAGATRDLLKGEHSAIIVGQSDNGLLKESPNLSAEIAQALRSMLDDTHDRVGIHRRHTPGFSWRDKAKAILKLIDAEREG
jgi:glycosyltransferase involved in cell wall biosynthesis